MPSTNRPTFYRRALLATRRWLAYPPLLLMTLTVLALLLAMGTAAQAQEAPSSDLETAAHDLAGASWDEFVPYLPERSLLVVTERWAGSETAWGGTDPTYAGDDVWRQTYDARLDESTWAVEIEPVLALLSAHKAPAPGGLSCDGAGVCVQSGDGYRLRLELGREGDAVKLLSVEIVWDEVLGC